LMFWANTFRSESLDLRMMVHLEKSVDESLQDDDHKSTDYK
jgi:hypothetical protein